MTLPTDQSELLTTGDESVCQGDQDVKNLFLNIRKLMNLEVSTCPFSSVIS